ncbi:MAG: hypothetical protein LBU73_06650 [Helicobacteraceae bacterium]|jgi:hypothetical protein|nr:hypothetical protein [Helicobacteraceae bacterium]
MGILQSPKVAENLIFGVVLAGIGRKDLLQGGFCLLQAKNWLLQRQKSLLQGL